MADGFKFQEWLQDTVFKPLEDKKMPVMEHLVELQVRLTRAVIKKKVLGLNKVKKSKNKKNKKLN